MTRPNPHWLCNRSTHDRQAVDAVAQWLRPIPWQWFVTATFTWNIRAETAAGTLCANMSETGSPSTITVGRGKKSHFDKLEQDKLFLRCVGSFGA